MLEAAPGVQVDGDILPSEKPGVALGEESLGLSIDMPVRLVSSARQELTQVTGMTLGEEKEPDPARPSLILCRAGSRSLWQIAKASGSSVEAIRRINELTDEPESGRMLLIPVS